MGVRGPWAPTQLDLRDFSSSLFRCGPHAREITKLQPKASVGGAASTLPRQETQSAGLPPTPQESGQAPASSVRQAMEGRALAREGKWEVGWTWATHTLPLPAPLQPELPGKPGTGESTGLRFPGVQPLLQVRLLAGTGGAPGLAQPQGVGVREQLELGRAQDRRGFHKGKS